MTTNLQGNIYIFNSETRTLLLLLHFHTYSAAQELKSLSLPRSFRLRHRDRLLRGLSLQTFRPITFRLREVFFAECTRDVSIFAVGHCYAKHVVCSACCMFCICHTHHRFSFCLDIFLGELSKPWSMALYRFAWVSDCRLFPA
jgi:hypothetical protein